jgi:hypothetical protein
MFHEVEMNKLSSKVSDVSEGVANVSEEAAKKLNNNEESVKASEVTGTTETTSSAPNVTTPRYFGEVALSLPVSQINVPDYLRNLAIPDGEKKRIKTLIAERGLKGEVHVLRDSSGYTLLSDPHYVDIATELQIPNLKCILIRNPLRTEDERKLYALDKFMLNVQLPKEYRIELVKESCELAIKIKKEKIRLDNIGQGKSDEDKESSSSDDLGNEKGTTAELCAKKAIVSIDSYKKGSKIIEERPDLWKLVKEKKMSLNAAWKEYKLGEASPDNPFRIIHEIRKAVEGVDRKLKALHGVYYDGMGDAAFNEAMVLKERLTSVGNLMTSLAVEIINANMRRRNNPSQEAA